MSRTYEDGIRDALKVLHLLREDVTGNPGRPPQKIESMHPKLICNIAVKNVEKLLDREKANANV